MTQLNTELLSALANKQDITEVFRLELETTINHLLVTELTAFLDYEPYNRPADAHNYRNGYSKREIDTAYGRITVQMPCDRVGAFNTPTIAPYQRHTDSLEETVIQLYRHGVSNREIAELIDHMYGAYYSPQTISNITDVVTEQVELFQMRGLSTEYAVVYVDATYVHLRRDTVENEAVYIMIGIRPDGLKEVLGYAIAPTESATIWEELMIDVKARGVEQILLFVADGVVGLQSTIAKHFPKAQFQRCLVHVARNFTAKVRMAERKAINDDFRAVRQSPTREEAENAMEAFVEAWGATYPSIKKLGKLDNLFTYYGFPPAIRGSIYSTNLIESFNKTFKVNMRKKQQFPNEESLDRYVVTQCLNYDDGRIGHCHRGFASCCDTLESMFD
ncbi:IS256 family transposase [Lacticaseibacillus paracasei]|uniref:IS256 family transposase n=1 Tax=Lacticaseibacillus paracasei TaxID=1597 RepID=UPI00222ED806|nr:IS256 family transposase [Lacticaseibacillus paracasei]UZD26736.1 IS256 family transposase [Lacticaseibacillus paracasei]